MKKKQYPQISFTLIYLFLLCVNFSISAQQTNEHPNVLFIAVDDLNDWAGPFGGYPGVITPNLDKLAAKGQIFTRAYCSAPACNPSRASLLTGILPSSSGVYHNDQPWRPVLASAITIPQYFSANGYDVEGIGKIFHNPYNDDASWPVYHKVVASPEPTSSPVNGKGHFDWSSVTVQDEAMGDYKNVNHAIDFFNTPRTKPFFLAVGFTRPHLPWYVPEKYFELYPLDSLKIPDVPENDLSDVPNAGVKIAGPNGDHKFIKEKNQWKKAIQGYLASITFSDAQIGRLLAALEKSPYHKNTIIVLFGDHGWHLGQKEHWRKFALWEEATRVPFIVLAPGITQAGSVSGRTVNLLDIYPTLIELTGLKSRKELEGNSLVPLLKNANASWDHPSLTTHGFGNHAVRTERWRYIRYKDGTEELYDHEHDHSEWNNLAKDPKYDSIKKELANALPKNNATDAPRKKGAKQD